MHVRTVGLVLGVAAVLVAGCTSTGGTPPPASQAIVSPSPSLGELP